MSRGADTVADPPVSAPAAPPAVRLDGILKRFPGVVANHDIHIEVARGTVHAIVGENGAGKSTLMKILYGMQKPDAGTIAVNGTEVSFSTPQHAIKAGIGMVHQHFMLVEPFTVLENLLLGAEGGMTLAEGARRARRRGPPPAMARPRRPAPGSPAR